MKLNDLLKFREPVILDGAMGTYLAEKGFIGEPKSANLETKKISSRNFRGDQEHALGFSQAVLDKPGLVEEIHREYIEAGSQVILTNTFTTPLEEDLHESAKADKKGIKIARKVRDNYKGVYVAGEIGPLRSIFYPEIGVSELGAIKIFKERGKLLEREGVDFIFLATFFHFAELYLAYSTIKEFTNLEVIPSFTFKEGTYRTMFGDSIDTIISWAEKYKVPAIGTNCGAGSYHTKLIAAEMLKSTSIPILAKPNAGAPELKDGAIVYPESIETFVSNCIEMVNLGVKFIGGCCGTTPEYIRNLKKNLENPNKDKV